MPISRQLACAVAFSISTFAASLYADDAYFVGLGDFPGGPHFSWAEDISADGRVVVGFGTTAAGRRAFRWTIEDGMVELTAPVPIVSSRAYGVSGNGDVIVGVVNIVETEDIAFRWTEADGMVLFEDDEFDGSFRSSAQAVSNDGSTIIGAMTIDSSTKTVVWGPNGELTVIDIPNNHYTDATCVSGNGKVIGMRAVIYGLPAARAFRWTQETGPVNLGYLTVPQDDFSPFSMSANGTTIVGTNYQPEVHAFRWNAETGFVYLDESLRDCVRSTATDVTADGSVIVGNCDGVNAIFWGPDGTPRKIRDILTNDLGVDISTWEVNQATAVSEDGSRLVGSGKNPNGFVEPWFARIPATACGCPGDVNSDGGVDGNDIRKFIDCLVGTEADCRCANTDGLVGVDVNDIAYFASTMLTGSNCP